MFSFPLAS